MPIIEDIPPLPRHFPKGWEDDFLEILFWVKRHQPYCIDGSILIDEDVNGLEMRVKPSDTTPDKVVLTPFEPYVESFVKTDDTNFTGTLYIGHGRLFTAALDGTEATITGLDETIDFTQETKVWLATTFNISRGAITACTISSGTAWPAAGAFSATGGTVWYQRLCEFSDPLNDKAIAADAEATGFDRGYEPDYADRHLFRYTYTHLRVESRCLDDATAWILTPA